MSGPDGSSGLLSAVAPKPVFIKQEQISPRVAAAQRQQETQKQKIDRLCDAGLTDAKRAIVVKQELLSDDEAGPMAAFIQHGEANFASPTVEATF